MRLSRFCLLYSLLAFSALGVTNAQTPVPAAAPSLSVDRDPAPSIDSDGVASVPTPDLIMPQGEKKVGGSDGKYTLEVNAYEVQFSVSVMDATGRPVQHLTRSAFHVVEDGVPQTIAGFRHEDLPVSIGLLIDSSASMYDKREAVDKAALELVRLSNPKDEEFLVDFSSKPYIDQEFTSSIDKLQKGLRYVNAVGGTAEYDAILASAGYLIKHGANRKQVLLLITDGEDNASRTTLQEAIHSVQGLEGPVVYCIGLLFGEDTDKMESRRARSLLQQIAQETGGEAFFPKSLKEVEGIAEIVAEDIRTQYTIGYHSTNPPSNGGYRQVHVDAFGPDNHKLTVRTRKGYIPKPTPVKPDGNATPKSAPVPASE